MAEAGADSQAEVAEEAEAVALAASEAEALAEAVPEGAGNKMAQRRNGVMAEEKGRGGELETLPILFKMK